MRTVLFTLSLLITAALSFAQNGEKNFIDQPYIRVTGTAEMNVEPDMIYLMIRLCETDTKGKISLESLEKRMMQRLTKLGINLQTDLKVDDLSSRYSNYFLREKEALQTRSYQLLLHTADMAGQVMAGLDDEGISNIAVIKTDHSLMAQKRFEVRMMAMQAAKAKAEGMAKAIGQSIGKAISIQEQDPYYAPVQTNVRYKDEEDLSDSAIDKPYVDFKTIEIKAGVEVVFILN